MTEENMTEENRLAAIKAAIEANLPEGLTAWQQAEADRLAELRLLAERLRARAINRRKVDLDRLAKIEGLCNRLARQLGLATPPKAKPPLPPWMRRAA